MPNKPIHPCSKPGCHQLTSMRFCPEHTKAEEKRYEKGRGSASERGYNSTWAKVRVMKLNEVPLCQRCSIVGIDKAAILVHHKDRNSRNNLMDNLESLCDACHDVEHKEERWG
jgi:5-methylcytosine-specific restriction protein A